ncbi:type I-E CRISPR-associated protein Cas6/Cse3/CasE [Saccharopolyspora shandongensis]|uniref:type I-E CRISPR-associated protein Cas6/Cse3/CasE n=1 Tax=Saccharopolyspora shandongensis TaxID=418495 RepID=UPI00340BF163
MTSTLNETTTLTQLRLNPQHRDVGRDLDDAHRMHRRVMSLFPNTLGDHARAQARILYRVEQHPIGAVVLVQSEHQPNLGALPPNYAAAATHQLDAVLARITTGLTVRYRILANPTRIETTEGKKKRRWLRGDDALTWWQHRATQAGLQPHTIQLTGETVITGRRGTHESTPRICHGTSLFDGTATIIDPDAVRHAVLTGIGKARAYGCGLLSLAPLPRE